MMTGVLRHCIVVVRVYPNIVPHGGDRWGTPRPHAHSRNRRHGWSRKNLLEFWEKKIVFFSQLASLQFPRLFGGV
jgi:hypothetical protein